MAYKLYINGVIRGSFLSKEAAENAARNSIAGHDPFLLTIFDADGYCGEDIYCYKGKSFNDRGIMNPGYCKIVIMKEEVAHEAI